MKKKLGLKRFAIFAVLIGLLGLVGFRVYQAVKSESQTAGGGPMMQGGRVPAVRIGAVRVGKVSERISLVGPLRPKEQVDLTPKISGRITELKVDTGFSVRQGDLIAVIEDAEILQQINRSKASILVSTASISQRESELANARAELDRKKQLLDAGLLSRQEFEAVQTRYQVATAQLELARAQKQQAEAELRELTIRHEQTRIYTPMAGAVAKRHVDIGAMVSPSVPIVTVVSTRTMVIHANASERDIGRIRLGETSIVTIDSLPGQQFKGRVMRISPLLDPQTRNGVVEIEIDNKDGVLKGEMFARVELDLGTSRNTTLVGRDALVYRGDKPGVYVLEEETARFRPVETGLTQGADVEVLAGLKEGETVITAGANALKDGDRVRVMKEGPPGEQAQGEQAPPQGQRGQGQQGGTR
jgi:RND family efflux transporter MFP subunit